jgi:hypothetical protein
MSIIKAAASALVNFLLMFGLCCAYGLIMFEDEWNAQHRGLAVKMNLGCAMITGLLLALASKIPVAIGGPDLNPVVFLGMFVETLAAELAKQHNLADVYPNNGYRRRLLDTCSMFDPIDVLRRLGSAASDVDFCTGSHL